jgi:hypothetical protein
LQDCPGCCGVSEQIRRDERNLRGESRLAVFHNYLCPQAWINLLKLLRFPAGVIGRLTGGDLNREQAGAAVQQPKLPTGKNDRKQQAGNQQP